MRSICDTLFDLQRSSQPPQKPSHHGHNNRNWLKNSLKVIFTKKFLAKVAIFCCFDVCSVQLPWIFQVQAKISTVRPVFPDYLSMSYDYGSVLSSKYIKTFFIKQAYIKAYTVISQLYHPTCYHRKPCKFLPHFHCR